MSFRQRPRLRNHAAPLHESSIGDRSSGATAQAGASALIRKLLNPGAARPAAIGAAQQNAAENIKRSLTQAFRFAADPCGLDDCGRLAVPAPRNATDAPGYSRPRRRLAAIKPITSSAPTSPTTPFQP
ncbi:hypothetical protein OKW39_002309 [Paraburkholderia sp. MM6662-R1]